MATRLNIRPSLRTDEGIHIDAWTPVSNTFLPYILHLSITNKKSYTEQITGITSHHSKGQSTQRQWIGHVLRSDSVMSMWALDSQFERTKTRAIPKNYTMLQWMVKVREDKKERTEDYHRQGRRSIWERGDTSPQYLDWGHYHECPPQYF